MFGAYTCNPHETAYVSSERDLSMLLFRLKAQDKSFTALHFAFSERTFYEQALFQKVLLKLENHKPLQEVEIALCNFSLQPGDLERLQDYLSRLLAGLHLFSAKKLTLRNQLPALEPFLFTLLGNFLKKNETLTDLVLGSIPKEEHLPFCNGILKNKHLTYLCFDQGYPIYTQALMLAVECNKSLLKIQKRDYAGRRGGITFLTEMFPEVSRRNRELLWAKRRFLFQAWVVAHRKSSELFTPVASFLPEMAKADLSQIDKTTWSISLPKLKKVEQASRMELAQLSTHLHTAAHHLKRGLAALQAAEKMMLDNHPLKKAGLS